MKALVKTAEVTGLEYIDIRKPIPKSNEVLIEVEAASICGTDVHYYHWDKAAIEFGSKFNIQFPFVIGHECAGTIVAVGNAVKERKVGERVSVETHIPCGTCYACQNKMAHNCSNMRVYGISCNGCFAQYAIADEKVTFVLPDEISFEEGALLEPAGVAMRAVEECKIKHGDTVVVNGCGAIGLMAIQILQVSGVSRVIGVDLDEYRLQMAEKFGAIPINLKQQDVIKTISELTKDRRGADTVIEVSGSSAAYDNIFEMIRNEGRIVTVGHPSDSVMIDIMKSINLKGVSIKGIFGRYIWDTWWDITSLVASKYINILDVVTHRFHFSEYSEAFDQIPKGAGKILFVKE